MPLTNINPETYTVPEGQVLLYSVSSDNTVMYYGKRHTGTVVETSASVLALLGVNDAKLPCLVYDSDFQNAFNESVTDTSGVTVATTAKSTANYINKAAGRKLDKMVYLSDMANIFKEVIHTDDLSGAGTAANPLALSASITSQLHTHENKDVLDNLSVVDGHLQYNGEDISVDVDMSDYYDKTEVDTITAGLSNSISVVNGMASDNMAKIVIVEKKTNDNTTQIAANAEKITELEGEIDTNTAGISTINTTVGGIQSEQTAQNERISALEQFRADANDSITVNTGAVSNNTAKIYELEEVVDGLSEKAHTHNTETNFTFTNELFGCTEKSEKYKAFSQITIPDETITEFTFVSAEDTGYIFVGDNKMFWTYATSAKYDGVLADITGSISGFTDAAATTNVIATIANNKLYVRGFSELASIPQGGNLLGATTTLSSADWTQVGTSDWKSIACLTEAWLAIDTTGKLYSAGAYTYGRQGVPTYTGTNNTLTQVGTATDWVDIGVGRYYYLGMRGSVAADGSKAGTLYAWGCNHTGCLGNGVSYRQDLKRSYAWINGTDVVHTFAAVPSVGTVVYAFNGKQEVLGALAAASDGSTLAINGTTYTRDAAKDLIPTELGELAPIPVAVPTFDTEGAVVSTTVYDDWFAMSAGWYHAGALRKDGNGKTQVYLWGENEYGQLGNGNYMSASLTQSSLSEANATEVEILSWPTLVVDDRFNDAVSITCTHYGTFIKCASGKLYFAGCNKRNHLGTGTFSEETAFIPKFVELSTMFTNNDLYVASYGALVVRNSPRLANTADPIIAATLSYPLAPENIDKAITSSHNHSVDPAVIDAAAILVSQFATSIPSAITSAHGHSNLTALNSINVRNGMLLINDVPITVNGGSSEGASVVVDPTNLQLDQLTDIAGLSNLAGGFGLDVISYRRVSGTEAYIRVAPMGAAVGPGRYVHLYDTLTETEIVPVEEQSKGLYGVPSNGTAGYINCTKDLVTMIEKVASASSASLNLYYVDTAHANSPATGTLYATFDAATLANYKLGWRPAGNYASEYLDVNDLPSVSLGTYTSTEEAFNTIYDSDENELISKAEFEANTYYSANGNAITSIGAMVIPTGADGEGNLTYSAVYGDAQLTNVVISAEQVAAGLYIKDGTMLVKVKQYMIPEEFNRALFTNGAIYIHPGKSNYSGMANQAYNFDAGSTVYQETDGELKSVILKLMTAITDGDPSRTMEYIPKAGDPTDPMVAAVYSANRYSTSSVSGEYNSAVGHNSTVHGNQNTVAGDFSSAGGLGNVVTGDMSTVDGRHNMMTANYSNALGNENVIAGTENIVIGDNNRTYGYYSSVYGDNNTVFGNTNIVIGVRNVAYGRDGYAVGLNNVIKKSASGSSAIGRDLDIAAEQASVVGHVGSVKRYEGNFPGDKLDDLYSITAAGYAAAGYDKVGIYNKNGLFLCAGNKNGNAKESIIPYAFTKYLWRPNNAFFGAGTGSSNRSNIDPYIYEPYLHHAFLGNISVTFTKAIADISDATKFTIEQRDGGRVKTFDPGVEDVTGGTLYLDFNVATRWKIKGTAQTLMIPKNFVDGAEAYIILYAGSNPSWTGFTTSIDESDGINVFDSLVWSGNEPEPQGASTGFAMVKLMIVDNVCVAQVIASTLA